MVDPWGNAYVYLYKNPENPNQWENFGYILFTIGADEKASSSGIDEARGVMDDENFRSAEDNIDNILLGE